jgi:hypothetical protein
LEGKKEGAEGRPSRKELKGRKGGKREGRKEGRKKERDAYIGSWDT